MAQRRRAPAQPETQPETIDLSATTQTVERRRKLALRALVEEMLTEIRSVAGGAEEWTPEERARAEADLARIMDQVRREAFRNSPTE